MSSPPPSPGSRKRAEAKAAAAASSSAKTSARKEAPAATTAAGATPAKPGAKDSGKPKTKKELEADRLAAEEAERRKPPATGSGMFEFANGAIFEGQWQEFENPSGGAPIKKRHGQGRFTNGGESYAGSWVAGEIAGRGRYNFSSGASYDGEWVANKFEGRGTYVWPAVAKFSTHRAMYIGDWADNKMHGVGVFLAATGDRYQGVFQNDRFLNAQGHWIAPMQEAGETAQTK